MAFFIRFLFFVFFSFSVFCSPAQADIRNAVLKVFVTSNEVDAYRPWQSRGSRSSTGSACVIPGHHILTNAHVISDHTFIQVRKESNPKKYTASVVAVGLDCDLAILKVDDPEFYDDITPIEFGELPDLQDTVTVIGFPAGGDKISVTEGVVSRVEVVPYAQSSKKLLAVQIDAAINPGNSGGPVFKDGKLAGIAMQMISQSQNIGFMIPLPTIEHFLDDLKDDEYDGFPTLGVEYQNTENKSLRGFFQIGDQEGGVIVSNVRPFYPADGILQKDDVILKVDDVPIGVDGTFSFRANERLIMSHLINLKQDGDDVSVSIMRNGKVLTKKIKLFSYPGLVPYPHYFEKPPYYIYGGLVFTVLSADLLRSWGNQWWEKAPLDFLNYLVGKDRFNSDKKKEIVVLLTVLPDDINIGYHDLQNEVIAGFNGKTFSSFEEFVRLVEQNKGRYSIFETENQVKIFLPSKDIQTVTGNIIERNNIPAPYSDDVAEWINPQGSK